MSKLNEIGSHKTSISVTPKLTSVIYHQTAVVTFNATTIRLFTGGWKSNTTKTRMNQTSNQSNLGYYVYQKNHKRFVNYNGAVIPFDMDRLTLDR